MNKNRKDVVSLVALTALMFTAPLATAQTSAPTDDKPSVGPNFKIEYALDVPTEATAQNF